METLGFEDEYLTVAELNGFEAALPVKFVPLQKEINAFRASKEDWELARMRKAQEITDRAFTEVCTRIPHRHDREGARGRADLLPV